MTGTTAYALLKKYVDDVLVGMGALKGAPCEVQSVNKVGTTTTVTLKWTDTAGTNHTTSFNIEDGISVIGATVNTSGNLILQLSDGTAIDCGKINSQFTTMPTPSASNVGAILQYVGTTTSNFINGYFYECVLNGSNYEWVQKAVQPNSGGGSIQVKVLPTASATEFGNIYQYIGSSTLQYKNGCFYKCVNGTTPGTYEWSAVNVEDPTTYEDDPIDFDDW